MKKISVAGLLLLACSLTVHAQSTHKTTKSKTTKTVAKAPPVSDKEINWISWDEVQKRMKQTPKKVYVDVYTGWCGWCKTMDRNTFSNPNVIKYINENFYAVKFDAESPDSVHFMGNHYGLNGRTNQFAVELLRGELSYPTTVIMEENFQNPQVIPGYQDVKAIEPILKYLAENHHRSERWEDYSQKFKAAW